MRFVYHPEAGAAQILLEGDPFRHLFRSRRSDRSAPVLLRNLRDDRLYTYRVEALDRRRAILSLTESRIEPVHPPRTLHIAWCVVDPKTVEKTLPSLNELGVSAITFLPCERSQRDFRLDFDRLERILINSAQQCGRSTLPVLERSESLERFLDAHPEAYLLDFSPRPLECAERIETLVVGPEGGFSPAERERFPRERIVGLATPTILRSETAVCAAAARILL
ncbi:16S rRNA (uracil(1498)-N(3))-methyltransferase [Nitratifractor sp.]